MTGPRISSAETTGAVVAQPQRGTPSSPSRSSALRSGLVYTLVSAAPRAVAFALLPVFTRVLTPSQYGQLSIAISVTTVAAILFGLGLDTALFRNFFLLDQDLPARERFVSTTWTFLLIAPWAIALVLGAIFAPILDVGRVLSPDQLLLALLAAVISVGSVTVPMVVLRAENRFRDYIAVTATNMIVSTSLSLVFVVWIRGGVLAYLGSIVIGNAATLVVSFRLIPYSRPKPFDWVVLRDTLSLSLPLVPHFLALWALQLADRFLVGAILGTAAAGLYSVASNLSLPMFIIVIGFGQAFMPAYARASKAEDARDSLRLTIASQVAVMSALCLACAALVPAAIHFLTSSQYSSAAGLAPWLVLGYGFQGFYSIPMNGITLTHGNTKGVAVISWTGAATNIGLIVWLAPKYGLEAVAIASAVGYAALLIGVSLFAVYRKAGLPYPWPRIFIIVSAAIMGYIGCVETSGYTSFWDVAARLIWIAAATGVIAMVAVGSRSLPEVVRDLRSLASRSL